MMCDWRNQFLSSSGIYFTGTATSCCVNAHQINTFDHVQTHTLHTCNVLESLAITSIIAEAHFIPVLCLIASITLSVCTISMLLQNILLYRKIHDGFTLK